MKRHELTDEQWALVEPHLPRSTARTGRPASDRRTQLNGIFWILATGVPWRDLPERYGPWQSVFDRFNRYRKDGTFDLILKRLRAKLDKLGRIDWDYWCFDGTSVRAARCAAGAKKARQIKRLATAAGALAASCT